MAESTHKCYEELEGKSYPYTSSAILAQSAATLVVGMTYFGIGAIYMTPTIVVGNLLNAINETISLNEEEASWFGGLPFLVMPLGALSGIIIQNYLGQRYGMILSNICGLISLISLYYAKNVVTLMISASLSGISLGFTEPAVMSYISEYSEPRIRGFLCSGTMFCASLGILFESFIGIVIHWRMGTLLCGLLPIVSLILLFLVPDSPVWLLSKGKKKEAMEALAWFRGWVDVKTVEQEFEDLKIYVRKSLTYDERNLQEERINLTGVTNKDFEMTQGEKKPKLLDLLISLLEKRTLRPFVLLNIFQIIIFAASSLGARSYVINLCKSLKIPEEVEKKGALAVGSALAIGNLSITIVLRFMKKRKTVAIVALIFSSLISITLGAYVHYKDQLQKPWLFIVLIFASNYVSSHCLTMPWMMLGEIFSVKNSTLACGMTAAIFDLLIFLFLKTYFVIDGFLGTEMFFIINGLIGIAGTVFLYFYLPEIEGKSLAEIDEMFSTK